MSKFLFVLVALFIAPLRVFGQAQLTYTFTGANNGDELGKGLACVGRFGSGVTVPPSNIALGEPGFNAGDGRARIISGANGTTVLFTRDSTITTEAVGTHVESVGDLNNDGFGDIFIGGAASNLNDAIIVYGPNGTSIVPIASAASSTDELGRASAPLLESIDTDAIEEVIVTAPGYDFVGGGPSIIDGGLVGIYSGADGSEILTIIGSASNDRLGTAVTSIQNSSTDPARDLVIGSPGASGSTGMVELRASDDAGFIRAAVGDAPGDEFGSSISNVGDVNGDGFEDIVVGAPGTNSGAGLARLLSGINFSTLCTIAGNPSDVLGFSVRGIGDQNGDGRPDFAVGAPNSQVSNPGKVILYQYNPSTLGCEELYSIGGTNLSQRYGFRIAGDRTKGVCDINADGFNDFGIASENDLSNTRKGWVDFYAQLTPTPATLTPTPTPTPTVTNSPVSTPSGTPTPMPDLPKKASLSYRISLSGDLIATSTFDSPPVGRCTVTLLGRRSRNDFSERGKIIELATKTARKATTFRALRLPKVDCCTDGKPYLFHMITKNSCEGAPDFYSNIFARRLTCGKKPPVPVAKWERVLQTRID